MPFNLDAIQCNFTLKESKIYEKVLTQLLLNFVQEIIIKIYYLFDELYETINKLYLNFMSDLFKLQLANRPVGEKYKTNMIISRFNQVSYGKKNLRTFGHKL